MNARPTPDDLSPASARPILHDQLWLELTEAANQAIRDGAADRARPLYERALREAERLFATLDAQGTAVPLPAILNIACHNLAQMHALAGDEAGAGRLRMLAFERLIGAAQRPATPIGLRVACVQHLRFTLSGLLPHLERQPDPRPAPQACLDRLHEVAAAVTHAATHARLAETCGHCRLRH